MILSIIKPAARQFFIPATFALVMVLCCFKSDIQMNNAQAVSYAHRCLNQSYNTAADAKLKKYELSITDDLFVRLRKTYTNGKQEYFSFRIKQFSDLIYLGTTKVGTLQLLTDADNIIQQTYNDPKGNEDNMVQSISIPVKNMEPERLDSLRTVLLFLRNSK